MQPSNEKSLKTVTCMVTSQGVLQSESMICTRPMFAKLKEFGAILPDAEFVENRRICTGHFTGLPEERSKGVSREDFIVEGLCGPANCLGFRTTPPRPPPKPREAISPRLQLPLGNIRFLTTLLTLTCSFLEGERSEEVAVGEKDPGRRRLSSLSTLSSIVNAHRLSISRQQSPTLESAQHTIQQLREALGVKEEEAQRFLRQQVDMEGRIADLQKDLQVAQSEVEELRKKDYRLLSMYTVAFVNAFDAAKELTGFSPDELQKYFMPALQGRLGRGRPGSLTKEDHVIIYLAVARMVPMSTIARRFHKQRHEIRDFVSNVQRSLDSHYKDKITLPSLEALHKTNADHVPNATYSSCASMICDGSGTIIYKPISFTVGRGMYTQHKGHHSFRFTAVVDASGKPIWVSRLYSGNMDDLTALRMVPGMFTGRKFMDDVHQAYPHVTFDDKLIFAADKGYVYFNTTDRSDEAIKSGDLKGTAAAAYPIGVHVTESGAVNVASEEKLEEFKAKRPFVTLSKELAPSRAVVERFFCRVKSMFPILAGPTYMRQWKMLSGFLRTACYIIQRMISDGSMVIAKRVLPDQPAQPEEEDDDDGLVGDEDDREGDDVEFQRVDVGGNGGFYVDDF